MRNGPCPSFTRGAVAAAGGTFSLTADVRTGGVSNTGIVRDSNGTVHPGRVGIWAGSGSAAVKGDNFKVRSLSADLAVDGRFADDICSCSISGGAYVMNTVSYHSNPATDYHLKTGHFEEVLVRVVGFSAWQPRDRRHGESAQNGSASDDCGVGAAWLVAATHC